MPVLVNKCHPFECYKLYTGLRLHFTQYKYHYNPGAGNFSFANFEMSKYRNSFETLAREYTLQDLEKLFIANMVESPGKFITAFSNNSSKDIVIKWQRRLVELDKLFLAELKRFNSRNSFGSIADIFNRLYDIQIVHTEEVKIATLEEMLDDDVLGNLKTESNGNLEYMLQLREYLPEFIVALDELFLRQYKKSFLINFLDNVDPKSEFFIKIYKYKSFVDLTSHFSNPESILCKLLQNP